MAFVKGAWKILVGIKDGLVLLFMLLFFALIFTALSARPNVASAEDGALTIAIDGSIVEEPAEINPLDLLTGGSAPTREYRTRDVIRAIEGAAGDDSVKVLVLDLDRFLGAGLADVSDIGDAIDKVKAAKKPVFAYATAYADSGYQLAAHANHVWVDPMGGVAVNGPGRSRLYYKDLLDRLAVTAHIYKVGTYKSAVEPYALSGMSDAARTADTALYGTVWEQWLDDVTKARPKAKIREITANPVPALEAADGNLAKFALDNGLVDHIGTRIEFGKAVAKIAGKDSDGELGEYAGSDLDLWLAANPADSSGAKIGVITIEGEIVDGYSGPGSASGDRISELLYDALKDDLKALVVRVDSPGGSVLASEQIRLAIAAHKATKIPVVVSMGNLAASGGYWVSTSSDHIMASPSTITGSIGVFAVLPSFENALAKWGVNADGIKTTPLSGQPDFLGGFNPTLDAVVQGSVENTYGKFLNRVGYARGKTVEQVDEIGQGRVWDGGTARQLGLVDSFGNLEDAVAMAAKMAKLDKGAYHAYYIDTPVSGFSAWLSSFLAPPEKSARLDVFARLSSQNSGVAERVVGDMRALLRVNGLQARCLECAAVVPERGTRVADSGWVEWLFAK